MPRRSRLYQVTVQSVVAAGVTPAAVRRWVRSAARKLRLPGGTISVAFVGPAASQRLNLAYRRKRRPTNVLSFRFRPPVEHVIGELILCPAVIRREVPRREYQKRVRYLLEHGLIHLTGRDHQTVADLRAWETIELTLSS